MLTLIEDLSKIQKSLNAPKGQRNTFGNYNYRSCEDILEAVKPLLGKNVITITDDIRVIADRIYVMATAELSNGSDKISSQAFAREPLSKKGMDDSQITGAASSYARKYALNGLLLIDDNKDADSMDNSSQQNPQKKEGEDGVIIASIEAVQTNPDAINVWAKTDNETRQRVWPLLSYNTKQILTKSGK